MSEQNDPRMERLGLTKAAAVKHWDEENRATIKAVAPSSDPDFYVARPLRSLVGWLVRMGLPYPFWTMLAHPARTVFSRQNVFTLQPSQVVNFSFKARSKGYLILGDIEVAPQDALAYTAIRIEFLLNNQRNSPEYSAHPGQEGGLWKYLSLIHI